jgi:hypothetical protein
MGGRAVAWALAAAGGIVALIGCLLPWIVLDFGRIAILVQSPTRSLSANAWSLDGLGKTALICSIVLLVAAVLVAAGQAGGARSALGVVIVVTGSIIGLVAIFEMARKGSYVDNLLRDSFSSRLHRTISDVEFARLKVVLDRLGFSVSFGVGLYLAAIGGILGVVGGVLTLAGRTPEAEPVAAGFATFGDAGAGPAVMPAPPVDPVLPVPPMDPPPLPVPPDVPPPPMPPDAPPLPAPPDVPPAPPISAGPPADGGGVDGAPTPARP